MVCDNYRLMIISATRARRVASRNKINENTEAVDVLVTNSIYNLLCLTISSMWANKLIEKKI